MENMPIARMGASMIHHKDKLYVYAGADPYGTGSVFSDFFSFDMTTGEWVKEKNFSELKNTSGVLLGQAVRM